MVVVVVRVEMFERGLRVVTVVTIVRVEMVVWIGMFELSLQIVTVGAAVVQRVFLERWGGFEEWVWMR